MKNILKFPVQFYNSKLFEINQNEKLGATKVYKTYFLIVR